MKKISNILLSLVLFVTVMFSVTACGGGGGSSAEKSPYEGKWKAMSVQMLGMSMTVEDAFDGAFEFEVKGGGKVTFTVGEEKGDGKWKVEDSKFTLTMEGQDMEGTIGENTITFEDMLGMGAKVIFAKEGTQAADPKLYLTEEEKTVVGEWMSESVKEVLGDPQTTMEGVENINDAFRMNVNADKTVDVVYKGQKLDTYTWSIFGTFFSIDKDESDKVNITGDINEDGSMEVTYDNQNDDDYYMFHCVKNDK